MTADALKDDLRAALKRERELRKHLRDLVTVVEKNVAFIEETMTKSESAERGKRLAAACNHLEMAKDLAKRFGLGKR